LPGLIFQGRNGRMDQSVSPDPLGDVSENRLNNTYFRYQTPEAGYASS